MLPVEPVELSIQSKCLNNVPAVPSNDFSGQTRQFDEDCFPIRIGSGDDLFGQVMRVDSDFRLVARDGSYSMKPTVQQRRAANLNQGFGTLVGQRPQGVNQPPPPAEKTAGSCRGCCFGLAFAEVCHGAGDPVSQ